MKRDERNLILIASQHEGIVETLQMCSDSLKARISYVARGNDVLQIDQSQPQSLFILDFDLPDMSGIECAKRLLADGKRPVVLVTHEPEAGMLIHAMRAGVDDVMLAPVSRDAILQTIERLLSAMSASRRLVSREKNLRRLCRRILRERRILTQRLDLICADVVGAQRRLFHRVLSESTHSQSKS